MDRAVIKVPRHDAGAHAIGHDEVEREIFNEELRIVLQRLAVKRMQDGMAGTVSGSACALNRRTIAEILHVAAKGALIDLAFFRTRERHAVMLKLVDGGGRFAGQIFHGVGIAQPVRPLHGVVHVPLPAIRPHVLERSGDAALRRNRMRAGRENLGDTSRLEALFGHAEGCAQARAAGSDHHHVELVIDIGVLACSGGRRIVYCTSHRAINLQS